MSRYVLHATAILDLLAGGRELPPEHEFLAPTLARSQVLEALYRDVRQGDLGREEGLERLARFARMRIRYLGDKVLRARAWAIAEALGWNGAAEAEYLALTELQADALLTLDDALAEVASTRVRTVGGETLA